MNEAQEYLQGIISRRKDWLNELFTDFEKWGIWKSENNAN